MQTTSPAWRPVPRKRWQCPAIPSKSTGKDLPVAPASRSNCASKAIERRPDLAPKHREWVNRQTGAWKFRTQKWGATRSNTQKMQLSDYLLLEAWEHAQKYWPEYSCVCLHERTFDLAESVVQDTFTSPVSKDATGFSALQVGFSRYQFPEACGACLRLKPNSAG